MSKITPCLWFEKDAEEAANLYVSLLPNSRIEHVQKNVSDGPSGKEGTVLVIYFTLAGQTFMALNGGTKEKYGYAMSLMIECEDQAEVDRLWDALLEGGRPEQCGWLRDRYEVPWQITPKALPRLLADPDPEKAKRVMQAMMGMIKIDIAGLEAAARGGKA